VGVNLLIVEDEPAIVDVLAAYAEREGYSTRWARDGEEAVALWDEEGEGTFDLVLLDLMLPRRSGDEVCRHIRARSNVPIVMLTAKGSEADVVSGLDAGADDYVAKPFSPRVLMARVRAHLRKNAASSSGPALGLKNILKLGPRIEIDPNRVEIRKDGQPIPVTRNEFLIFSTLALPPIRTWSRDDIIHTALGDEYDGFDRTVDTYVKNLRKKLAEPGHENGWIQTVHGFGYKIDDSEPARP
jgi:DNA-binding response OmpR family regulator